MPLTDTSPAPVFGPQRPAIIAHRFWCPSCDAQPGEPCRLSPKFTQDYSHVSRHRVAQRHEWRALMLEIEREQSPIASIGFAEVGR